MWARTEAALARGARPRRARSWPARLSGAPRALRGTCDEDRLRRAAWAVPVVYAVHVAEEAPGFADWARRHASSGYTDRDFVPINGAGFALTAAATAVAARTERRSVFLACVHMTLPRVGYAVAVSAALASGSLPSQHPFAA